MVVAALAISVVSIGVLPAVDPPVVPSVFASTSLIPHLLDYEPFPPYLRVQADLWKDDRIPYIDFANNVSHAYEYGHIRITDDSVFYYDDAPLLVEIAALELSVGNLSRAAEYASIAGWVAPDHGDVLALMTTLALLDGDRASASHYVQRSIEADPHGLYPNYAMAIFLYLEERWADSIPHAERALEIYPGDTNLREILKRTRAAAAEAEREDRVVYGDHVGTLDRVVNGDTLIVDGIKVQVSLVDAPDYGYLGKLAKEFVERICLGTTITLDVDDDNPRDRYGRVLAEVFCDGTSLNAVLANSPHGVIDIRYCQNSEFADRPWAYAACSI